MTSTNHIVGQNLRLFREEMRLTQEALAEYLNIAREMISYYETGTRSIPTEQLSKLANLFCIEEYDFYEEDPSKRKLNIALAFRADALQTSDLKGIAQFKKIVRNYVTMKELLSHE
jgi:transcriptional regulator with XRE-family HTH domain